VPSALFERRQDIRQAEATGRRHRPIRVAKADFFPRMFLSGHAAEPDDRRQQVGPQGLFSVGPQVFLPIFNMGRTRAGVDPPSPGQTALAQYQQTIQQAFRDVPTLVELRKRRVPHPAGGAAVSARDAARLAGSLSRRRLLPGGLDSEAVIDARIAWCPPAATSCWPVRCTELGAAGGARPWRRVRRR
jgi:outer membrane protein TolC